MELSETACEGQIKHVLFGPHEGKDLFRSHPQLKEVKEFSILSPTEMEFVWKWRCGSFDQLYFGIEDRRLEDSIDSTFSEKNNYQSLRADYLSGKMPEKIRSAGVKMELFSPDYRFRAKQMVIKMFENIEAITTIGKSEFIDGEGHIDADRQKNYTSICEKAIELIPQLIAQIENGYGITDVKDTDGTPKAKPIDTFHKEKR